MDFLVDVHLGPIPLLLVLLVVLLSPDTDDIDPLWVGAFAVLVTLLYFVAYQGR